jgi:hypothetical protein
MTTHAINLSTTLVELTARLPRRRLLVASRGDGQRKEKRSFALRTLIVLAALAAGLMSCSVAKAATGRVGWNSGVQVTCTGNRIIVTGPSMGPAYDYLFINGNLITNPVQQVAYRAYVAKLINNTWVRQASGPWKTRFVNNDGSGALDSTWFTIYQPGRYAVYAEYYWYPNQYFPYSGYDIQWAPFTADFNAGGYMGWGDPSCG